MFVSCNKKLALLLYFVVYPGNRSFFFHCVSCIHCVMFRRVRRTKIREIIKIKQFL